MKKIFYSLIAVAGLAACQSVDKEAVPAAPQQVVSAPVEQVQAEAPVARKRSVTTARRSRPAPVASVPVESAPRQTGSYEIPSENAGKEVARKKGWSDAAKGAVIGGVVGAGAGAVIDKNKRGRGAIIGGVIGAGAGYAIGRSRDRKSGRVVSGGGLIPEPFIN